MVNPTVSELERYSTRPEGRWPCSRFRLTLPHATVRAHRLLMPGDFNPNQLSTAVKEQMS
jgi:hypothetical protein